MKTPKLTKVTAAAKRAVMSVFHTLFEAIRTRFARGYRLRFSQKTIVVSIRATSLQDEAERVLSGTLKAAEIAAACSLDDHLSPHLKLAMASEPTGGVFVITRVNKLSVSRLGPVLVFRSPEATYSTEIQTMFVPFASESDANDALYRIQKRLLSNRPLVWATRLVALGIVWLFVSSYLQVKARENAAAQQTIASNSGEALAPLPGAQSDLQAFPGATSDSAPLPMGSSEPDPVLPSASPAPSPAAATTIASPSASGLAGFGLDTSASTPSNATTVPTAAVPPQAAAEVAASGIPAKGPGCDPALAFKAPVR
ncbi:MAG: hypothetical protein ACREPQ_00925 [Rhodanobacter sp.]